MSKVMKLDKAAIYALNIFPKSYDTNLTGRAPDLTGNSSTCNTIIDLLDKCKT